MKAQSLLAILAASVTLALEGAAASDVTLPHRFVAGTPARAAEVNANFDALGAAVDDNHARLSTLEGQNLDSRLTSVEANKQNRVTGTCAAGSAIRAISSTGSVTCEADDATAVSAAAPLSMSGSTIGLSPGGITDTHISPAAAIAATKISGDAGIEFNNTFWQNLNIPTTVTSLGQIVVSAPGPGWILLMLNGTADNVGVNMLHEFGIGTTPDAFSISRPVTPTTNAQPFSVNWVVPVSAAGDHTFHALARKVDPTACCNASAYDVNLVALYVPKRY